MNKLILLFIGCLLVSTLSAQMLYIALVPCITTTTGNIGAKLSPAIEFGKQWDVFSIGFDIGKISCLPMKGRDTSVYFELRPNLNIFQVGKFTNTFTPGIGYVMGSKMLMLEMTSGLEYAYTEKFHINMFFGQYFYSGLIVNTSVSFIGISLVKFFSEYKPKAAILNNQK